MYELFYHCSFDSIFAACPELQSERDGRRQGIVIAIPAIPSASEIGSVYLPWQAVLTFLTFRAFKIHSKTFMIVRVIFSLICSCKNYKLRR